MRWIRTISLPNWRWITKLKFRKLENQGAYIYVMRLTKAKKIYCRKIDFVWIIWEVSNSPKVIPVTHNKLLEYNDAYRRTWRTSYYNSSEIRGIIKQPGAELPLHKGSGFLHMLEWEGIHAMRWTLQPLLIFILLGKDDLCGISNL